MGRFIVVLSFLLTTSPLFAQKEFDLTGDSALSTIFNETEIEGFESMIRFVDNMVSNSGNENDINKAYHLFFEKIAQTSEYKAAFEENMKYKFLESMDSSVFNAIWSFDPPQLDIVRYRDTVYRNLENFKTLQLKPFSRYMDYLKEIGKDDPYFESLQKMFENVGNLSAGYAYWFQENHAIFDFNIPKNRLWVTIYLLSLEEPLEMKLDRYFGNR